MKAKDTVTLNTIRLIRSAFVNSAIELRAETLTDDQVRHFVANTTRYALDIVSVASFGSRRKHICWKGSFIYICLSYYSSWLTPF